MQDQPDATAQLYAALAKAQGAFSPIKKDRDGQTGNQKFKYADFDQLIAATRPAKSSAEPAATAAASAR